MKQIKHSEKREALIKLLQSTDSHPDADWIYSHMREIYPNISLGTVYRNLNFLTEQGSILKLSVGTGTEHYDANINTHSHLVCSSCGAIKDIHDIYMDEVFYKIESEHSIRIDSHCLIFQGLCAECNKLKN